MDETAALIDGIRANVIGDDEAVVGPFGLRRVTYADYTASGRSLAFIEDFIREAVLPLYGNTHTESSGTGLQTTRFREDARRIIRDAVGGNEHDHVVLFAGSGSTGAIDKLLDCLQIRLPADLDDRYDLARLVPADERPVVFIGPYEHHSNELPWRESLADVVVIPEDHDGRIDLARLEAELTAYADRPLKIGSFSAASNVTGVISDVRGISILLHRHGALSFWDVAAAAPYVSIEMGPFAETAGGRETDPLAYKDAIFISPHKFIGGPGTPGVLVARRELFQNRVPIGARRRHRRLREPGRARLPRPTSSIARRAARRRSSSRSGPASCSGSSRRSGRRRSASARSRSSAARSSAGQLTRTSRSSATRPSTGCRSCRSSSGCRTPARMDAGGHRYLHHNYVVALLNDLFGIQSRGGCSCAGPYGHRLLGIDLDTSHEFEREIGRGCEGIKPGWIRVNFNYFISEPVFAFILEAVELVATDGWRLLPHYRFEPATGLWQHAGGTADPPMSLTDVSYVDGEMRWPSHRRTEPESALAGYLEEARRLMADPPAPLAAPEHLVVDDDFETLRWFPLPDEVAIPAR